LFSPVTDLLRVPVLAVFPSITLVLVRLMFQTGSVSRPSFGFWWAIANNLLDKLLMLCINIAAPPKTAN